MDHKIRHSFVSYKALNFRIEILLQFFFKILGYLSETSVLMDKINKFVLTKKENYNEKRI
jgi:hypothetical protein